MSFKVAVITGSRRGIGRAIAYAIAELGLDVVVSDTLEDEDTVKTVETIECMGRRARFVRCDVTSQVDRDRLLDTAAEMGHPTVLVNNAGVSSTVRGDMLQLPTESFDRAIDVNLRAPFLLSQSFANRLLSETEHDGSFRSIINITSVNATILGIDRPDYCISKAGLSMMTRLFAARLAGDGIHVYEVRPGMTLTEMTLPSRAKYDLMIENSEVPMRRWGKPDDIGRAVAQLASGMFAFTTGEAIHVDGGLNLHRV